MDKSSLPVIVPFSQIFEKILRQRHEEYLLYTLIANFVAVNAKTLDLTSMKGILLFDMIYGNKTDIEIDMVTGDNHSLNQLNFVALDAIDVEYVPSIKNVREAANDLYSIKPADHYTGLLKPKKN